MTSSPENKITRSDLVKSAVNVGALGMEFSWTYYKQMNIAFCLMVANMLKKIYAGRPDDYAGFANTSNPLPVSSSDFRLDSTIGQPWRMPVSMPLPGSSSSWVTVSRTMS